MPNNEDVVDMYYSETRDITKTMALCEEILEMAGGKDQRRKPVGSDTRPHVPLLQWSPRRDDHCGVQMTSQADSAAGGNPLKRGGKAPSIENGYNMGGSGGEEGIHSRTGGEIIGGRISALVSALKLPKR